MSLTSQAYPNPWMDAPLAQYRYLPRRSQALNQITLQIIPKHKLKLEPDLIQGHHHHGLSLYFMT